MFESQKNNIALFFGSFDPVHVGHLIIAEYLLAYTDAEEIWFVVSPQNPFKVNQQQTHQDLRKKMTELAIIDYYGFKVCDIEFGMESPNYTHKTLSRLREIYPGKDFSLVIGSDNLVEFEHWKNYRQILEATNVYVYPRPGFDTDMFTDYANVKKTKAPLIEISSSYIRDQFTRGHSPRAMLPERVYNFIESNKLYK